MTYTPSDLAMPIQRSNKVKTILHTFEQGLGEECCPCDDLFCDCSSVPYRFVDDCQEAFGAIIPALGGDDTAGLMQPWNTNGWFNTDNAGHYLANDIAQPAEARISWYPYDQKNHIEDCIVSEVTYENTNGWTTSVEMTLVHWWVDTNNFVKCTVNSSGARFWLGGTFLENTDFLPSAFGVFRMTSKLYIDPDTDKATLCIVISVDGLVRTVVKDITDYPLLVPGATAVASSAIGINHNFTGTRTDLVFTNYKSTIRDYPVLKWQDAFNSPLCDDFDGAAGTHPCDANPALTCTDSINLSEYDGASNLIPWRDAAGIPAAAISGELQAPSVNLIQPGEYLCTKVEATPGGDFPAGQWGSLNDAGDHVQLGIRVTGGGSLTAIPTTPVSQFAYTCILWYEDQVYFFTQENGVNVRNMAAGNNLLGKDPTPALWLSGTTWDQNLNPTQKDIYPVVPYYCYGPKGILPNSSLSPVVNFLRGDPVLAFPQERQAAYPCIHRSPTAVRTVQSVGCGGSRPVFRCNSPDQPKEFCTLTNCQLVGEDRASIQPCSICPHRQ